MEKLQEANLNSVAWKFLETDNEIIYSIQFNEVPWKLRKPLLEAMKDWKASSYGWHKNTGNQIFIFRRSFKSLEDWIKWAESFPLQIIEKRVWGNKEKTILHGSNKVKNEKR